MWRFPFIARWLTPSIHLELEELALDAEQDQIDLEHARRTGAKERAWVSPAGGDRGGFDPTGDFL